VLADLADLDGALATQRAEEATRANGKRGPRSREVAWYLQRLSPASADRVSRLVARRVDRKLSRPG
jgi:hypothetical protein